MESKAEEQRLYDSDVPLALADRANADPHSGFEAVAPLFKMGKVIGDLKTLQYGHEREGRSAVKQPRELGEDRVVALYGEALVFRNAQSGFGEHEGFAHIVLRRSDRDVHDAFGPEPVKLPSVDLRGFGIPTVLLQHRKRAAINENRTAEQRFSPHHEAMDRHAATVEMFRIGRLVQTRKKEKSPVVQTGLP